MKRNRSIKIIFITQVKAGRDQRHSEGEKHLLLFQSQAKNILQLPHLWPGANEVKCVCTLLILFFTTFFLEIASYKYLCICTFYVSTLHKVSMSELVRVHMQTYAHLTKENVNRM